MHLGSGIGLGLGRGSGLGSGFGFGTFGFLGQHYFLCTTLQLLTGSDSRSLRVPKLELIYQVDIETDDFSY